MKKAFVSGIIVLASSFALAAPVKTTREALVEYNKQWKEYVYGKSGSAAKTADMGIAKNRIVEQLGVHGRASEIKNALSGNVSAKHMDAFVSIIAAKKLAAEWSKTDSAEAQSLNAAADASTKALLNRSLRDVPKKTELGENLTVVTEALNKIEEMPAEILTNFSKAERDSYTLVLEKYDEINSRVTSLKAEDNFVQAIMEVKKVDRAKALEIVRKLKECV
ncbi:hypothetical protein [Bdellovibrio bacteriovorus]|uniref:Uncharacterized protein n=1 Tax=Bdellovibrio bacteriovorus TaxID=959 RepID=A0A150WCT5_BDEBC|nr:hypothetical protein [Bdellovibrio bacteriovorus]KYG60700.1 hypothetical protein AZI85_11940 [Bdellovibrio bacteriovorus]